MLKFCVNKQSKLSYLPPRIVDVARQSHSRDLNNPRCEFFEAPLATFSFHSPPTLPVLSKPEAGVRNPPFGFESLGHEHSKMKLRCSKRSYPPGFAQFLIQGLWFRNSKYLHWRFPHPKYVNYQRNSSYSPPKNQNPMILELSSTEIGDLIPDYSN
jgi:hypothetical protein